MVKKREKHAAPAEEQPAVQSGWGNPAPHPDPVSMLPPEQQGEAVASGGNISDNPEDRRPPLDEGWDETTPPSPMAMPAAADPAPAEAPKPKKGKAKGKAKAEEKMAPSASGEVTTAHNKDPLVAFIERIERLAEEQTALRDDMKEVFAEAKGQGYDVTIIRTMLRRRRMGVEAVREMEALIDAYEKVIGYD